MILKLFFKWGIEFEKKPYSIPEKSERKVYYSDAAEVEKAIVTKYGLTISETPQPQPTKVPNKGKVKVQNEQYIIIDGE